MTEAERSNRELLDALIDNQLKDASKIIKTYTGKEWFYDETRRLQLKENVEAQKLIAELANYKFTKEKIKLN